MFDVSGVYLTAGIMEISVLILLLLIDPGQNRRELGEVDPES